VTGVARGSLDGNVEKVQFLIRMIIGSGNFGKFPGSAFRHGIPDLPEA